MRVVIYGRCNRNDSRLTTQMSEMRSYCKSRGYDVVREVTDCCSGSQTGDNMVGLLNEPIKEFDAIVIRDLSRISRNLVMTVETTKMMRTKGIRLIVTDMPELADMGKLLKQKNS